LNAGKVVGLCGPIGAGKSLCARVAVEEGWTVADADKLVHALYGPGQELSQALFAAFPGIEAPDGGVDRKALGKVVFADREALLRLNALVHPAVRTHMARLAAEARRNGGLLVLEIPLLSRRESFYSDLDAVVAVLADDAVRLSRVMERDRLSEEEAQARLERAVAPQEIRSCATHVLENSSDPESFRREASLLWRALAYRT